MQTELTQEQIEAAQALRNTRPPTYEGSNVIISLRARGDWYEAVGYAITIHKVPRRLVDKFCDIAGVPD